MLMIKNFFVRQLTIKAGVLSLLMMLSTPFCLAENKPAEPVKTRLGIVNTTIIIFPDGETGYNMNNLQILLEPDRYKSMLEAVLQGKAGISYVKGVIYIRENSLERLTGLKLQYYSNINRISPLRGFSAGFHGIPIRATSFEPQIIASKGKRGDWNMDRWDMGAALPSRRFLGKRVLVYYPETGKSVVVPVIDVGPWNTKDEWLLEGRRPKAESGIDERGRNTNKAGLDLSYPVWVELGVDFDRAYSGKFSAMVEFILLD